MSISDTWITDVDRLGPHGWCMAPSLHVLKAKNQRSALDQHDRYTQKREIKTRYWPHSCDVTECQHAGKSTQVADFTRSYNSWDVWRLHFWVPKYNDKLHMVYLLREKSKIEINVVRKPKNESEKWGQKERQRKHKRNPLGFQVHSPAWQLLWSFHAPEILINGGIALLCTIPVRFSVSINIIFICPLRVAAWSLSNICCIAAVTAIDCLWMGERVSIRHMMTSFLLRIVSVLLELCGEHDRTINGDG